MKKTLSTIFFICAFQIHSQSNFKRFFGLSKPLKAWVLCHPFKAKKAFVISQEARKVSDSIQKSNLLDGDASGGQVDAFRHAYWMARLHQQIGKSAARSLGKAHEKENYRTFKELKLEDGVLPDEISSEMDLYNNEQGLKLSSKGSDISKNSLMYRVVNAIQKGNLKIIKKNKKGNFLTCDDRIIQEDSLKRKWKNNKCLVFSNFDKE
jgi:hypothetical protein